MKLYSRVVSLPYFPLCVMKMIFSKSLGWHRVEMAHFQMYLRLELSISLHYSVISCNTVYPALIRGIKDVCPFSQHAQGFMNMLT